MFLFSTSSCLGIIEALEGILSLVLAIESMTCKMNFIEGDSTSRDSHGIGGVMNHVDKES